MSEGSVRRTGVGVVLLCTLVGCGANASAGQSGPASPTRSTPASTPEPVSIATPADTPLPTPDAQSVGTTIPTTDGSSFTVVRYVQSLQSDNIFETPPPGGTIAGLQVKVCASSTESTPLVVNPFQFVLVMPDDTQVDPGAYEVSGHTDFPSTTLNPGLCVSGWIFYGIVGRPTQIQLQHSNLVWSLS